MDWILLYCLVFQIISQKTQQKEFSVFHSERRNDKIIQENQHLLLVLPKDCMSLTNTEPDNEVRTEIVTALADEVNIKPVTDHGFQWLAGEDMHGGVRDVTAYF